MATRLLESLPAPPLAVDNTMGVTDWGMDGNGPDPANPPQIPGGVGDCTIAGIDHHQQVIALDSGNRTQATTAQVLQGYSQYCGYVLGNDATDQGGNENSILTQILAAKGGIFGHTLLGTVSPDPKNLDHVKKAITYFRAVYMGCLIPNSIDGQQVWDVVNPDGGIEGGHCMVSASYTPDRIDFITWGMNQPATWAWWLDYVDECHVLVWDTTLNLFPASTQQTILNMLEEVN